MVPQTHEIAADMRSSGNAGNTALSRLNPPSPNPRTHVGISFVDFNASVSKESRKTVRAQAAKASAAARKVTILARDLAARKRVIAGAEDVSEPAIRASWHTKSTSHRENAVIEAFSPRVTQESPGATRLVVAEHLQSPSEASSQSLKALSDTEIETSEIPPADTSARRLIRSPSPCVWPETPSYPCRRSQCRKVLPASHTGRSSRLDLGPTNTGAGVHIYAMRAYARYLSPSPTRNSVARHEPFNCYPVQWRSWYDEVLHHMRTVFAPCAWAKLKITPSEGAEWERFVIQNAMEEPAFCYVRLLFGSGYLVRIGALRSDRYYHLQSKAIKAINDALSEEKRSISNGLILAVGRIALHECMYGDQNVADTIHRPAQRRMIDLRGGMKNLEFPHLVKRLMRWSCERRPPWPVCFQTEADKPKRSRLCEVPGCFDYRRVSTSWTVSRPGQLFKPRETRGVTIEHHISLFA